MCILFELFYFSKYETNNYMYYKYYILIERTATKVSCIFISFVLIYMYFRLRSSNQEGDWGPINWFSPDTFLCLSQARTLIAIATSYVVGGGVGVFSEWRREGTVRFVDVGGIVDHHCLNFFYIIGTID